MWFRLALSLGMSVRECQARIDSAEFSEWTAYYNLEPFGPRVQALGHAITAQTVANAFSGKKEPYSAAEFLPKVAREQSDSGMTVWEKIKTWALANGGKKK